MATKFLKGSACGVTAYILIVWAVLNIALPVLVAVMVALVVLSVIAVFRLKRLVATKAFRDDAPPWDRDDFGFWTGIIVSVIGAIGLFAVTPFYAR
jgi:uncharacterized membrane protein YfcA